MNLKKTVTSGAARAQHEINSRRAIDEMEQYDQMRAEADELNTYIASSELEIAAWSSHLSTMRSIRDNLNNRMCLHRNKAATQIQARCLTRTRSSRRLAEACLAHTRPAGRAQDGFLFRDHVELHPTP